MEKENVQKLIDASKGLTMKQIKRILYNERFSVSVESNKITVTSKENPSIRAASNGMHEPYEKPYIIDLLIDEVESKLMRDNIEVNSDNIQVGDFDIDGKTSEVCTKLNELISNLKNVKAKKAYMSGRVASAFDIAYPKEFTMYKPIEYDHITDCIYEAGTLNLGDYSIQIFVDNYLSWYDNTVYYKK